MGSRCTPLSWLVRLHRDERGSAYVLSYMMVLPIVVVLLILIGETAMIMVAKTGVTYAAFAAARSSSVWQFNEGIAQQKATQAAVQAMAPFANGLKATALSGQSSTAVEDDFVALYRSATTNPMSDAYIRRKYRYARDAISVTSSHQAAKNGNQPGAYDIKVSVEYRYSFHMPFVSRFFGSADGKLRIHSTAILPAEVPMNDKRSLGISYASH